MKIMYMQHDNIQISKERTLDKIWYNIAWYKQEAYLKIKGNRTADIVNSCSFFVLIEKFKLLSILNKIQNN